MATGDGGRAMKRLAELRAQLRPILIPIVLAGATAILTAVAWASWSYRRMADAALDARFIPRFKEPPPGPRAPGSDAFGARVGASSLQVVQQLIQRMGIDCPDTSARALLGRARAARVAAAEDRKRRGLPPDAVSGASGNRRSPMERNPQVRLSCEDLPASALTDRTRAPSIGRLLFVFDSPEHPVRHISYQRTMTDAVVARAELEVAVAAYRRRFGAPRKQPKADVVGLPWLSPMDYEWNYADLTVRVAALNFGGARGTMLTETVEVPLPIRPDAPAASYAGR